MYFFLIGIFAELAVIFYLFLFLDTMGIYMYV